MAINKTSGHIKITKCNCPQQADGKCSHVAAAMYLIEDLMMGVTPRISAACTSQPRTWKQGAAGVRNPKALHLANYNKTKYRGGAYYDFDPRPADKRSTTTEEINSFVGHLEQMKKPSMWLDVLKQKFEDYEVDDNRRNILKVLSNEFLQGLHQQINSAPLDPMSNDHGIHFGATVDQADCQLWLDLRKYRVTASIFKDFVMTPKSVTRRMMWQTPPNLSRVVAIQWGVKNEKHAIKAFADVHGQVSKVGLFVSKKFPFLGASPDGFWKGCVVEVKCPYILSHCYPWEIKGLTAQQKRNLCVEKIDGELRLKRSHKYFWQIQCQLFVTGATRAKFIV